MVGGDFEFNPKYDEVVWSGMCYLKEVGSDFSVGGFDMSIISKDGKFGMIYTEHWNVPDEDFHAPVYSEIGALECVYDAIYSLDSENSGRFVVFQGGKCGLVQAVCAGFNQFLECMEIFPCVYDRIELIAKDYCGVAVLQSGRKLFYYNLDTGHRSIFYDRIWTEKSFIFCAVDGETEVFDSTDDRLIMRSKEEIDYIGVYKNRCIFIERSGVFDRDKNDEPIINGKYCFYKRGNNAVLKTKKLEHVSVLKKENGFCSKIIRLSCSGKKKTKANLHQHYMEIIVSKDELFEQLKSLAKQDNLLKLLIYGKALSDYELILQKISLKFEFAGSLVYALNGKTKKLPAKTYKKELFDNFYGSFGETKIRMEMLLEREVCDDEVWRAYAKLQFFAETVCGILTEEEIHGESTYRKIIEYVIECSGFTIGKSGRYYGKSFSEDSARKLKKAFKSAGNSDFRR